MRPGDMNGSAAPEQVAVLRTVSVTCDSVPRASFRAAASRAAVARCFAIGTSSARMPWTGACRTNIHGTDTDTISRATILSLLGVQTISPGSPRLAAWDSDTWKRRACLDCPIRVRPGGEQALYDGRACGGVRGPSTGAVERREATLRAGERRRSQKAVSERKGEGGCCCSVVCG